MSKRLCKGKCGNIARYNGWCGISWVSGNRFGVSCPLILEKRGKAISKYKIKESKLGKNPMQNPEICKKNHSLSRNKKTSETLKKLGKLGLLPQQIENKKLKEKRRKNISEKLKKMFSEGIHPRQLESKNKRKSRLNKMAKKLSLLGKEGKLPSQNRSSKQKEIIGKKISLKLREGLRNGRIKLSPGWKKIHYKNLILRSYWEKIVAEFLDKNNISWEYESKRIPYIDTSKNEEAITIPDFYLPKSNIIIEVKSNAEYNSQKTKDKINGIKLKGFKTFLFGRKEIQQIKNDKKRILNLIKK